ncbi:MAG: iron-binding protein [Campylobacterales bacterium]|nr:iron-binding protein [Campylobacterales bacterium]
MDLANIYKVKHELWLKVLFASFAIKDDKIKSEIYEFSQIQFRHLKWLSNGCKDQNVKYDYNRLEIDCKQNSNFDYFSYIINEIKISMRQYDQSVLFARIISDEFYMIQRLELLLDKASNDGEITAFNKERIYENKKLDKTSTDAFTIFLFEETYKEYELILVYSYMQNYTEDITLYNVYQDLIDESLYHLKCFGNMLSKMGILSVPRIVIESIYQRDDIEKFLVDGIAEEEAAKEECIKLSQAVKDEELSKFFEYINYQENYHIELMQKAIKALKEK